jgi:peptide subunit release factor 1 (eRF1)
MKISNLIEKLGSFEPDGYPFLSIYINAEPGQNGRDTFPIWLKGELSGQGQQYKDNETEQARYDQVVERINQYIEKEVDPSANGVAIFASIGDTQMFEAVQLNVPFPANQFFAYDRPHIFPLACLVHENPRYAVLWADTNKADIYVFGGENRIRTDVNLDNKVEQVKNDVTQQSQAGGWSQQRFQRRIEGFHLQHAKETVAELEELMKKVDVEHLVLCGDEATIMPILKPQLSKPLEEKVIATLNMSQYDTEDEIYEKTREAVTMEMATRQAAEVERLNDAAKSSAGLGTLGVEETLRALANGQVEELVVASNIDAIDYSKREVEKVLDEYAPGDDQLEVDTPPIVTIPGEVADQLILRALTTGAKIMFIKDDSLLKEAGGVGAILRYNMNSTATAQ